MNTTFATQPSGAVPVLGHRGIRRILVSLDFSADSESCVRQAAFMAKACESDLTLLYVMQPVHEAAGQQATDTLGWEIARQHAVATLERFQREAEQASGRPVDARLDQGRPADRIAAIAHEVGADLIVFGSHGEGGATVTLGGTAQQVVAAAECSVFIARAGATSGDTFSPKRILLPLDGSPRTESTLPTVVRIARASGAEVLLAHVVLDPLPTEVLRTAEDLDLARELASRVEARAKEYLARIGDQLGRDLTRVRSVVVRSVDQPQSLLDLAHNERIDLAILSAHGATCNRERSFGSVTTYLLSHAPVPIVVLQDLTTDDMHLREHDLGAAPRRPSGPKRGTA